MTYQLTEVEKEQIAELGRVFWADFKVMTYGDAVIFFVNSHRHRFDYPQVFKRCSNPEEVMAAVLHSPEYKNRPNISCSYMQDSVLRHGFSIGGTVEEEAAKFMTRIR